jgi:hypothetical protein
VWHPVGPLPSRVYWRRRLVVLTLLVAVLGGGTWAGIALVQRADARTESAAPSRSTRPPALDRVVPSLASVATPSPPVADDGADETAAAPAGPRAGDPCTDDMIQVAVTTPGTVAVGGKPTFELVITNVSAVPCVRSLDKNRQEIALFDQAGARVWGSNDCIPETSSDERTLAPGEAVAFPLVWSGLSSEPTCTAARGTPPPGGYVLRGRLDTKVSPDAPLVLE